MCGWRGDLCRGKNKVLENKAEATDFLLPQLYLR